MSDLAGQGMTRCTCPARQASPSFPQRLAWGGATGGVGRHNTANKRPDVAETAGKPSASER
jgi:hypothetical protein